MGLWALEGTVSLSSPSRRLHGPPRGCSLFGAGKQPVLRPVAYHQIGTSAASQVKGGAASRRDRSHAQPRLGRAWRGPTP